MGDRNPAEMKFLWHKIDSVSDITGEILLAAQFDQIMNKMADNEAPIEKFRSSGSIPADILPEKSLYHIEVYFWGVRNLSKIYLLPINSPKFVFQCADSSVEAITQSGTSLNQNFLDPIKKISVVCSKF